MTGTKYIGSAFESQTELKIWQKEKIGKIGGTRWSHSKFDVFCESIPFSLTPTFQFRLFSPWICTSPLEKLYSLQTRLFTSISNSDSLILVFNSILWEIHGKRRKLTIRQALVQQLGFCYSIVLQTFQNDFGRPRKRVYVSIIGR